MRSLEGVTSFPRRSICLAALIMMVLSSLALPVRKAFACGCLIPPDAAQPLVQAAEEIVFSVEDGRILMHVKIRYSGRAGDFGWLLPLPSVPVNIHGVQGIDIGVDELFSQLETRTQPTYILQRNFCSSGSSLPSIGCGAGDAPQNEPDTSSVAQMSPLVTQNSVGPYDYAILKADDKSAMLNWLSTNRYVVPTGTDTAIDAYIRPGAYLLALRLSAGAQTGDLQPVVLSYPADLPMIPIVLTSVGASANMGILIWVIGDGRAIPRNYAHTIINDAQLDWLNKVKNYNDVITRAVSEAPGKHAFVTEYSDSNGIMNQVLDTNGRFDVVSKLTGQRDPIQFIKAILPLQRTDSELGMGRLPYTRILRGFALNGQFFAVVGAHVPVPQQLIAEGVTPADFYQRIGDYLQIDRARRPAVYADIEAKLAAFNPAALVKDLTERIVNPTLDIGNHLDLRQSARLTRLYTTLSPEDMTADPVFSFNASLPAVSNVHRGVLALSCDHGGTLTTEAGFVQTFNDDEIARSAYKPVDAPSSQRRENLLDTGMPVVVVDNTQAIKDALPMTDAHGCRTSVQPRGTSSAYLGMCGLVITALFFRRRRRRSATS